VKAAKPSAKPAKEAAPAAGTGVTLEQVAKAWKQISAAIKSNMSLGALLNSCKLLELKNNTLTLGFSSDILRTKADTPEQIEAIRNAIAEVLNAKLSVKCVVSNAKHSAPADVKVDGMVAAALRKGGEIVDVQE
jgi:F0F1-type ATP synthase delta subunit